MKNNTIISFFFIFFIGMHMQAQPAQLKKPNVLVIFTDDHRFSGVHALGGQKVSTPAIDGLASRGIAFTRTYLMGSFSGATCIPSRAMLLTGRPLFALKGIGREIPQTHTTMGEAFQKAGYNSHIIGKWHQDIASLKRSFNSGRKIMGLGVYLEDHFRMPFWDWDQGTSLTKKEAYLLQYDAKGNPISRSLTDQDVRGPIGTEQDGPHTSSVFADQAITFITNYRKKAPFFLYVAFHAPHDPRQAPLPYKNKYPPDQVTLPPSYLPQHPFDNGDLVLRDEKLAPWPRTPEIAKQHLADYYATISHMDAQIGRIIKALKESGKYENTLIVFAGDSGLAVGNHGLMGKQNLYDEDGIHVPFIISGNLIQDQGRKTDALCYIHDIFPTLCELTDIPVPVTVSGKSLLPVINGKTTKIRDYSYHAYKQFQRAYRKGDYKLISYVRAEDFDKDRGKLLKGSRVVQLFNIKKDPWETHNLAIFPEYNALLKTLEEEMQNAATQLGDDKGNITFTYNFWDYYE